MPLSDAVVPYDEAPPDHGPDQRGRHLQCHVRLRLRHASGEYDDDDDDDDDDDHGDHDDHDDHDDDDVGGGES
jgi:hypothetical protein